MSVTLVHRYLAEVVRHRLSEFELQVNAVKEGLHSVVPPVVFSLFTWRELEARVCGTSEINVEALRKITDHNLPEKERNPVAVMFWKVKVEVVQVVSESHGRWSRR